MAGLNEDLQRWRPLSPFDVGDIGRRAAGEGKLAKRQTHPSARPAQPAADEYRIIDVC